MLEEETFFVRFENGPIHKAQATGTSQGTKAVWESVKDRLMQSVLDKLEHQQLPSSEKELVELALAKFFMNMLNYEKMEEWFSSLTLMQMEMLGVLALNFLDGESD